MKFRVNPIRLLDFALAAGSLVYGAYVSSTLWIIGGVLGFPLAIVNPAERIRKYLFGRIRPSATPEIAPSTGFPAPPATPYVPPHARKLGA